MTREEKENLLREAVDILIKLDNHLMTSRDNAEFSGWVEDLFALEEQEPKTDKYEYHTDHTDCIWYGNDSGCPVTCSQYRDGWNDAMDYIFKNGKGYQPYRHDGWPQEISYTVEQDLNEYTGNIEIIEKKY